MSAKELIDIYIQFFEKRGHKRIANSPLVPDNDPTTLFTSSGMQPIIQYLLGQEHPMGIRLVNVQNSFRAQDIDEVGDSRHTTFFRMLGNWSLGDYFKKEEIPWLWEFLTVELGLPKEKLYVTVFDGVKGVPHDEESELIWQEIFKKENIEPKIFRGDVTKNWWSRSGVPDNMPIGEPGGPDTEVYYRFDNVEHNPECKDNPIDCECGKFLEIANSVFMQYVKTDKGFEDLPKQSVDFGGGLERLLAAVENKSDIFQTSLYKSVIETILDYSQKKYDKDNKAPIQVIADHLKAATYIIASGVEPSNKERGYVLRRLLRRAAVKMHQLKGGLTPIPAFEAICDEILRSEEEISSEVLKRARDRELIFNVIKEEMGKFADSLDRGLKIFENYNESQLNELNAFNLYQSYGFPFEISEELFLQKGKKLNRENFNNILESHKNLSRTASAGMFKGGLADHSELTIMGHTATHLLHQALRDVLGNAVHQTGSNITNERIRFDFNFDRNLTEDELKKVEGIVNRKITENLPVHFEMMPVAKAKEIGAIGLFDEKYAEDVKVYFIGSYSKEFCGGPHVEFTGELNRFKIIKQENLGKGQKRIYSKVNSQI